MNNALATPLKNIFSRGAVKVLNACAKFAYNFAYGFGIKFTDLSGSKTVAIDTDSEALQSWIKEVAAGDLAESIALVDTSGYMANDYDARYDEGTEPVKPEEDGAEYLWQRMTKDEKNSTDDAVVYKGYKENAVVAVVEQDGSHYLWFVEKQYTPEGLLKSVSKLKGFTLIGA